MEIFEAVFGLLEMVAEWFRAKGESAADERAALAEAPVSYQMGGRAKDSEPAEAPRRGVRQ
jgi:hypothetical protein